MRTRDANFANTKENRQFCGRTDERTDFRYIGFVVTKRHISCLRFQHPTFDFFSPFVFFFDYARAILAYYIFAQNPILKRGAHAPFSQIGHFLPVLRHFCTRTYSESCLNFRRAKPNVVSFSVLASRHPFGPNANHPRSFIFTRT